MLKAANCVCVGVALAAVLAPSREAAAMSIEYQNQVLSDHPLAYWRFDETSGATATNLGSFLTTLNGTYSNVALGQTSAFAGLDTAAGFNGSNSQVLIPYAGGALAISGSNPFTVELWFNAINTTRGDLFTYKDGASDFGIHWSSNTARRINTWHNGYLSFSGATDLATNTWYDMVFTRASGGAVTVYINGSVYETATDTLGLASTNGAIIGSNFNTYPTPALVFNGRIDEVAFYNYALSPAQALTHFDVAAAIPEPATLSLLALGGLAILRRRRRA